LSQILLNLVGNAVKFTQEGLIEVSVMQDAESERVCFVIRDSGIGMTRETLNGLFRPFTQGDESTTRRYGGTGLGLSISRMLAERMGGDLDASSEPGKGSVFTARVLLPPASGPVLPAAPEADAGDQAFDPWGENEPFRILLAEDNLVNQKVARHLLARLGYEIDVAANGKEVLECVKRQDYDLVLMDVQMPEMDGIEATRLLKETDLHAQQVLPVVFALTAGVTEAEQSRCRAAGMEGFVHKPIQLQTLRQAIGEAQRLVRIRRGGTTANATE
jgi:CheY-like chemotaxis protein/anti-sigma regulatory factor (Ser/Thr protein kinase)